MGNAPRRLFIALPVDDELVLKFLKDAVILLQRFSPVLKIVPQENYHITIKFLGSVEADKADILIKDFQALTGLKKTGYSIGGMGSFPSSDNPSVIWAGMKCDSGPFEEIVKAVEQFASRNGFAPEKRKFSPHLTLGRIRREKKVPADLKKFLKQEYKDLFQFSVFKELVLFESILTETGPDYKKISVIPLA